MRYIAFLSYSSLDWDLIEDLEDLLKQDGVEASVAESNSTPGSSLDEEVFRQIDNADCVVALLTRNGVRSNWVHHETGYALGTNKRVIPVVERGVDTRELAALQGKVYIEYDGIEQGITDELIQQGIPSEHIVLAFQSEKAA